MDGFHVMADLKTNESEAYLPVIALTVQPANKLGNYNTALELKALYDSKTGLPNRDLFDDRLSHAIAQAKRRAWTLGVVFLDLNRFKCVKNAHFGWPAV
jgi:GGDEF domain-containing protein